MAGDAYLGDGLYVCHDGFTIELYAHDGIQKTNQVFLEPEVLQALTAYLKRQFPKESEGNSPESEVNSLT